jgi:von Willebrand factor type A domain
MATRGNGKDSFDALLARGLGMSITDSARGCPDADVLAAFASHALSASEHGHWEGHVADCALCQHDIAALARTGLSIERTGDRAAQAATVAAISEDDESTYHAIRKSTSEIIENIRSAMRFMMGPFPLSVTIHLALILFLIITVHEQRGRELIMVNLEAGGGGGGGSEMNDLDMPEVPMPDTAPQQMDQPTAVDTSQAVGLANDYVRAAGGGGIGIGRGGGVGSGYGKGIGSGFGGFIGELRRKGLDVVIVCDGTGSMQLIIDDVKAKMGQLVHAIHRLVPIARVGMVVFGGKGQKMNVQPLTLNPQKLVDFLNTVHAEGGDEWEEDLAGGVNTAIREMDWKPYAKKVIVLVGDSPPKKDDFQPLIAEIHQFKSNNGTFNTVDVAAEEHERFEREFWLKVHREEPPKISPLPEFYQQTRAAFKVLANAGGGAMRSLSKDSHINQQVLVLAFGEQWQSQVAAFGRGITAGSQ